ncbi:secretion protein snm4 [Streptomyces sp. NRRL F-4489]|uniref:secretion protein snm4 n=1 Tax=Streptomyces sp. NRRL F-4489 TaxID=1609095 RepID=UPI0007472E74|nr:secretion protein snm4 [Streptomyces sp. NRRL F-4489]KUL36244.1 secretion protein snm4 [Streptomyces sp. NRRL F-4489]
MQNGRVDMTSATTGAGTGAEARGGSGRPPAPEPAATGLRAAGLPSPGGRNDAPDGPWDEAQGPSGGLWGSRWDDRTRAWTATAATVLLAAVAGTCALAWYGSGAALGLAVAAAVAAAGGTALTAAPGRRAAGTALLLAGAALGLLAAWYATPAGPARLAATGLTAAAALALLGLRNGPVPGGPAGAAATAVAVGAWELLLPAGTVRAGVALGFLSVLALGALPRLALRTAGLTRLDGGQPGGSPVGRQRVAAALAAAHRGLAPATVAQAASAGAAGVLAAGGSGPWPVLTALLLAAVLFSRARAYPLAMEVAALLAAGTAVCLRLVVRCAVDGGAPAPALAALGVLAALPVAALAVRLPEPLRDRLGRRLDLAESVCMVALIPAGLGAFGLYGLLPFGA